MLAVAVVLAVLLGLPVLHVDDLLAHHRLLHGVLLLHLAMVLADRLFQIAVVDAQCRHLLRRTGQLRLLRRQLLLLRLQKREEENMKNPSRNSKGKLLRAVNKPESFERKINYLISFGNISLKNLEQINLI